MDVRDILHIDPWIEYKNTFVRSKIVLQYPKNLIFTLQLLKRHANNPIFDRYPLAERFDTGALLLVDWHRTIIAFDTDDNVSVAPDAVKALINLERRLRPEEAARAIFDPFRFFPVHVFRYCWIVWIVTAIALVWIRLRSYSTYLVLSPRP